MSTLAVSRLVSTDANTNLTISTGNTGGAGFVLSSSTCDVTLYGNTTANGSLTITNWPFIKNTPVVSANYIISSTYNEMSVGPITLADGVTITCAGEWVIV